MTSTRRSSADASTTRLDVHLEIDLREPDVFARLADGNVGEISDLERAAAQIHASVLSAVPRRRRIDVVIESGRVTDQIIQREHILSTRERTFLFAACGATLLQLTDGLISSSAINMPSELAPNSLSGLDVPVALSPSAALSLIEHCSQDNEGEHNTERHSCVSSFRRYWSPYPPHSIPKSLILKGLLCGGGDASYKDQLWPIDPRSCLSTRPDWWSQPFGVLRDRLGSINVSCETTAAPPRRALLLDAVTPLSNGASRTECEVEFSIFSHGHREAMCDRPVRLLMEVTKLLSSVASAIGAARPGMSLDPITGNRFGMASILLTTVRSRELMESLQ